MEKRIPVKCQQAAVNGLLCDNDTQGVAAYEGEEGKTLYVGLSARHGRDLIKAVKASWLTVEVAERRIADQAPKIHAAGKVEEVEEVEEEEAEEVEEVEEVKEVKEVKEVEEVEGASEVTPAALSAQAHALLAKVKVLREQANLVPLIATELLATAAQLQAQALDLQVQARKLAQAQIVRVVHPLGARYLALRAKLYLGGVEALAAFDEARGCGYVWVHGTGKAKGSKAPKAPTTSGEGTAPTTANPGGGRITPERQALINRAHEMFRAGTIPADITRALIPDGDSRKGFQVINRNTCTAAGCSAPGCAHKMAA